MPDPQASAGGDVPSVGMIADVLDRAASKVAAQALWKKGDPETANKICAGLAIMHEGGSFRAVNAFCAHLGISPGIVSIYAWNDAPERTQEEVVQALREAASAAREMGNG